jgi:hypothetical protein
MRTVKEQLCDGDIALRRLTAAMNSREFHADGTATLEPERPYSIHFTRALLNYCFGNASEAATLRAIQVDDAGVLTMFARQFSEAAQRAGMDEAALEELQIALWQSEAMASAT